MKKRLDLKILENADKNTLEALSGKYRAVDDKKADELFRRITNNTDDHYDEVQVHDVEVFHRPVWRKAVAAVMTPLIAVGTLAGGTYFYSHLKSTRNIESSAEYDSASGSTKNTFTPVALTNDYQGAILGVDNWHIEEEIHEDFSMICFINDDTNYSFADYQSFKYDVSAYLSDLDDDGIPELICNGAYGIVEDDNYNSTVIFRLNNGVIEFGKFIDDYDSFAEENGLTITDHTDFSDRYDIERDKIILTSKYSDQEYELSIDRFTFNTMEAYPVRIDVPTVCYEPGMEKWQISRQRLTDDTESTYITDKTTGETFLLFTGYKNKTSVYYADIDNDGRHELVCNYQYGDTPDAMYDHVKIFRENHDSLECGTFLSDFESFEKENNIELGSCDDFTEKYNPDTNRIILQKQDDGTRYKLDSEYYHFKNYQY